MMALVVKMWYHSCLYLSIVSLILTSQCFARRQFTETDSAAVEKEAVKSAVESVENPNCAFNYNNKTNGQVYDLEEVQFQAEIDAISGNVTFTLIQLRDVSLQVLRIKDELAGSYDYTVVGGAFGVRGTISYPSGDVLPFTVGLNSFDFNIKRLQNGSVTHAPIRKKSVPHYLLRSIVIPPEYQDKTNAIKRDIVHMFNVEGDSADSVFSVSVEGALEKSFLDFKLNYGCEGISS